MRASKPKLLRLYQEMADLTKPKCGEIERRMTTPYKPRHAELGLKPYAGGPAELADLTALKHLEKM